jgi:GTP diphosphokinase / guanosine-3',5'-bis(diphosphate) 3'-diphosphatase
MNVSLDENMENKKLTYRAMLYAELIHRDQRRKYTNAPYFTHLAEVAGLVGSIYRSPVPICIAWLHDSIEDCGITHHMLVKNFNVEIADGVQWLSDMEEGNREERKRLSRERLSRAPHWIQDIKICDLISNTSSIIQFDPKFAVTYLKEKRMLLDSFKNPNLDLLRMCKNYVG